MESRGVCPRTWTSKVPRWGTFPGSLVKTQTGAGSSKVPQWGTIPGDIDTPVGTRVGTLVRQANTRKK